MKKVIRTMAAVAILFATTTGMAKEPKLETDGISKSLIFEWETQIKEASLKILDTNGNLVFTDQINRGDAYFKKFDLTPLAKGAYFLKIQNGVKELVYSISVNKNNISILGMEESFKPNYRNKEGRVYLNFLNQDMGGVKLKVTDSFGNVLHDELIRDSLVVEKVFNFQDAYVGDYTIALNDGEKTYYETYSVKK